VAWVQAQDMSCRICGGQSGTGAGFRQVLWFPLPLIAPHSSSCIILDWYNRPSSSQQYQVDSISSHPTPPQKKKEKRKKVWEPSMGTSHRLPKPVSRKQLINRVTNNRNRTAIAAPSRLGHQFVALGPQLMLGCGWYAPLLTLCKYTTCVMRSLKWSFLM
jgi:hypothetical protein